MMCGTENLHKASACIPPRSAEIVTLNHEAARNFSARLWYKWQ